MTSSTRRPMRRWPMVIAAVVLPLIGSLWSTGPAITSTAAAQSPISPPNTPLAAGTYCNQTPSQPTPAGQLPVAGDYNGPTKVLQIFEENESAAAMDADGAANAKFEMDTLGAQCGVLSNMHGETHPSEPNYLDNADGGNNPNWTYCDSPPNSNRSCTYGASSQITAPNVFSQVESKYGARGWRVYGQSQTQNCQMTDGLDGLFVARHNPPQFFTGLNCAANSIPSGNWQNSQGQFYTDVQAGALPPFSMYTPNDTDDGHDPTTYSSAATNIGNLDTALQRLMTVVQSGPDYQSGRLIVMVTFDEGTTTGQPPFTDAKTAEDCTDRAQGDTKPSCQILTYVVGRYVPWQSDNDFANHYSMLKTTQKILGLTPANGYPYLGHAGDMMTSDFYSQFKLAPDSWTRDDIPPNPPTVPSAPTGAAASAGNGIASVTFTAPASSGGGSIDSYTVTANPGGVTGTAARSPVVLSGLSNNTAYTFTVAANNRFGTGPASGASNQAIPVANSGAELLPDPGFESGVGNWQAFTASTTVARVTSQVHAGTGALQSTSTNASAATAGIQQPKAFPSITQGLSYTASCWVTATKAGLTGAFRLLETTPAAATVGVIGQTTVGSYPVGSWTKVSVSGTALRTGERIFPQFYASNQSTTTGNLVFDDCSASNGLPPTVAVPGAPSGAVAAAGDGSATVGFTAPANNGGAPVTGYVVTSQPGGIVARGSSSPIAVNGLTNGVSYAFTVQATNSAGTGTISPLTNVVTPQSAATVPDPPTAIVGTAGDAAAAVSFAAPADDGGSPVTGYTVTSSPGGVTAHGAASPINVAGLVNGTAYSFTVVAENAVGSSAPSGPSDPVTPTGAVAPTAPDAPANAVATAGDSSASVTFDAPASNGGLPITGYTATASPGGATATGPVSPLSISGLINGTAYTFTVVATNTVGDGPASDPSNPVTPQATVSAPGAPSGLQSTAGPGRATLSWTAPTVNGGAPVSDYVVNYRPAGAPNWSVFDDGISTSGTATVIGLTNGQAYEFRVAAVNSAGAGPFSGSAAATPVSVPDSPTAVTAVAGNAAATVSFTVPVGNGGSTITSYRVTSTPGAVTANGTGSPIVVSGLTNGTAYTFTVAAINAVGQSTSSAASAAVTPMAPARELLPDPGFESGNGGWVAFSVGTLTRVSSPVHGGRTTLKVASPNTAAQLVGLTQNSVVANSVAGASYGFSCWVQATAPNLNLTARFLEYTQNYSSNIHLNPVTTLAAVPVGVWTKVAVTSTAINSGERVIPQIYSSNETSANGSIYYDDCSVTGP